MIIFIEKYGKDLVYADYCSELQPFIDNWKSVKTIRVFKGKVFIKHISFNFFTELMRNANIKHQTISQIQ